MTQIHDLESAVAYCKDRKLALTLPRRAVLETILISDRPLGAYDILERLQNVLNNPKPPTIYRAIDFWQSNGFIHRIESLNAYTPCMANHHHKGSQFIICDECGGAQEIHLCDIPQELRDKGAAAGHNISYWVVELHGICISCQGKSQGKTGGTSDR